MTQQELEKEIAYLLERKAKLKKEINQRSLKIRDLEIELKVYSKLKGEKDNG